MNIYNHYVFSFKILITSKILDTTIGPYIFIKFVHKMNFEARQFIFQVAANQKYCVL